MGADVEKENVGWAKKQKFNSVFTVYPECHCSSFLTVQRMGAEARMVRVSSKQLFFLFRRLF